VGLAWQRVQFKLGLKLPSGLVIRVVADSEQNFFHWVCKACFYLHPCLFCGVCTLLFYWHNNAGAWFKNLAVYANNRCYRDIALLVQNLAGPYSG
jgi:hypothetical protein